MKTNIAVKLPKPVTHEGAPAVRIGAEKELRRTLLSCMLWESNFYESGVSVADRLRTLVPQVKPLIVAKLAVEARENYKLRHAPLFIVREMVRHVTHRPYVADTLERVIQRADELAEFMAMYQDGKEKQPVANQVKKGLAAAFSKFNEYQFSKYNRDGKYKLRDVMFLVHPKPEGPRSKFTKFERKNGNEPITDREKLYQRIAQDELEVPNTWEVELSAGKDKRATWERLLSENKLGALALLRNLRNMQQVGVSEKLIFSALEKMKVDRVLPFRFITAARYAPQWEAQLEQAMFKCLEGRSKLPGKTVLLVDVSGSMDHPVSDKSELMRLDAANGLAILARELCEQVAILTFSDQVKLVPPRHGFALRDAIYNSQPHSGTYLGQAINTVNNGEKYDRLIVLTDEQSHDPVGQPNAKGYLINVASYKNGVGYGGNWTHIDGWSESVFDYICEVESAE